MRAMEHPLFRMHNPLEMTLRALRVNVRQCAVFPSSDGHPER
jgi:hypothetical protein